MLPLLRVQLHPSRQCKPCIFLLAFFHHEASAQYSMFHTVRCLVTMNEALEGRPSFGALSVPCRATWHTSASRINATVVRMVSRRYRVLPVSCPRRSCGDWWFSAPFRSFVLRLHFGLASVSIELSARTCPSGPAGGAVFTMGSQIASVMIWSPMSWYHLET